ncbi:MAG: EsaB/YukD family protein [Clostridia bacterium]|nr:EsaB/YukD family protein [Clostridia bacterium]
MSKIIITLTNPRRDFSYDLEVPTDEPLEKLYADIIEVLCTQDQRFADYATRMRLYVLRKQRYMLPGETLDVCGVLNGDYLLLG